RVVSARPDGRRVRRGGICAATGTTQRDLPIPLWISHRQAAGATSRRSATSRGGARTDRADFAERETAASPGAIPGQAARAGENRDYGQGVMKKEFQLFAEAGAPHPCCVPSKHRAVQLHGSRAASAQRTHAATGSTSDMVKLDGGRFLMGTDDE